MANTPDKPTTGYSAGPYCRGYDGTDPQTLKVDSDGHPQVDVLSAALPSGAATATNQATQIANQGKPPTVKITFTGANYAGTVLTCDETLQVDTVYLLHDLACLLTGGTAGNTTQPSLGETSTFTQGSLDDRYKMSATIDKDVARTIDSLPGAIRVRTDGNGKLYLRGAAPGSADSTLTARAELTQARDGA